MISHHLHTLYEEWSHRFLPATHVWQVRRLTHAQMTAWGTGGLRPHELRALCHAVSESPPTGKPRPTATHSALFCPGPGAAPVLLASLGALRTLCTLCVCGAGKPAQQFIAQLKDRTSALPPPSDDED